MFLCCFFHSPFLTQYYTTGYQATQVTLPPVHVNNERFPLVNFLNSKAALDLLEVLFLLIHKN